LKATPQLSSTIASIRLSKRNADHEQLYRTLLNLIRNAAEAVKPRDGARIEVSAEQENTNLAIRIRDNGTGIPDLCGQNCFQPFAASTRSAGTGLGLAIARDLARAHGGDVVLESTGESGTCFPHRYSRPGEALSELGSEDLSRLRRRAHARGRGSAGACGRRSA